MITSLFPVAFSTHISEISWSNFTVVLKSPRRRLHLSRAKKLCSASLGLQVPKPAELSRSSISGRWTWDVPLGSSRHVPQKRPFPSSPVRRKSAIHPPPAWLRTKVILLVESYKGLGTVIFTRPLGIILTEWSRVFSWRPKRISKPTPPLYFANCLKFCTNLVL